jgi:hypothetical protein
MIPAYRTTLRLQRTIVRTMSTGQKVSDAAGTTVVSGGPVERAIREKVIPANTLSPQKHVLNVVPKLTTLLQPTSIKINNDSWQHRHHTAMRESGTGNGETRRPPMFQVEIISSLIFSRVPLCRLFCAGRLSGL